MRKRRPIRAPTSKEIRCEQRKWKRDREHDGKSTNSRNREVEGNMSRIKMLQDVVQDLRSLTDSLEVLANVIEDSASMPNEPVKAEAPASTPAPPIPNSAPVSGGAGAPKPPALAELRAFVAERSTPQTRPKIRALLARHGVAKLTELPESAYLDLMREVAAL